MVLIVVDRHSQIHYHWCRHWYDDWATFEFLVLNNISFAIHDKLSHRRGRFYLFNRVTITTAVSDSSESGHFAFSQTTIFKVRIQGIVPFGKEFLPVFHFLDECTSAAKVTRSSATNATPEVEAICRGDIDAFPTTRAAIDYGAAATWNVVEDYRRATANARNAVATHSRAVRQSIKETSKSIINNASFLGTTEARKARVVDLKAILVDPAKLTIFSFVWFAAATKRKPHRNAIDRATWTTKPLYRTHSAGAA